MWMKQAIHWYIKLFLIELIIVAILIMLAGFSVIFNDNDIEFTAKYIVGLILFSFILFLIGFVCFGFIVVIKHIYYFIYGRFIKQLEENYQELSKIETQETSE